MRTAIALEKRLSKDQILEGYLNIALFGDNTWGVEAAASYYFKTSAAKLTLVQAATLAGLVQSPGNYSPFDHPDKALNRRNEVLGPDVPLGDDHQKQYDEAKASKLITKRTPSHNGCITAGNAAYFCDYVINLIADRPFVRLPRQDPDRAGDQSQARRLLDRHHRWTRRPQAIATARRDQPRADP